MPYDRTLHHRRSIRLPGYDYTSPGAYFVTLCVRGGECLFGSVVDGEMQLNQWGQIAHEEWLASEELRPELRLDSFAIMPNHLHGIIWIVSADPADDINKAAPNVGAQGRAPVARAHIANTPPQRPPRSLGSFVAGYKTAVTKRINQRRGMSGTPFWQRNYWDHIIRSEASLNRIREYIDSNALRWLEDQLHPNAPPNQFNQWQG